MQFQCLPKISQINQSFHIIQPQSKLQPQCDVNQASDATSFTLKQTLNKKRKSKRLKEISTNIIQIKPSQTQEENQPKFSSSYLIPEPITIAQTQQKSNQVFVTNEKDRNGKIRSIQNLMLIDLQSDESIQNSQQIIPQSSRRPFKDQQEKCIEQEKILTCQQLSPKRARSRKSPAKQNGERYIQKKKQIKLLKQNQTADVYDYEDEESLQNENRKETDIEAEQQIQDQESDHENNSSNKQSRQKKREQAFNSQLVVMKSNSFYTLINADIPKGNFVNCIIKRKQAFSFFDQLVIYELYLLQDRKFLMSCVKNKFLNAASHFQFYKERSSESNYGKQNLYGYLDSNFTGTEFVLKTIVKNDTISQKSTAVDKTDHSRHNQSATKFIDQTKKDIDFFQNSIKFHKNEWNLQIKQNKQVSYISFKTNLFGLAGQREAKVLKKRNKKLEITGQFSDLKEAQLNGQFQKYYQFKTKPAILGRNGLQLDFKNIAKVQSNKNIILEDQNSKEVLIFGKVKQNIYSVAIGSPFSILQGLAFGIANLDRKLFVN